MKSSFVALAISLACSASYGGFVDGNKLQKLADAHKRVSLPNPSQSDFNDAFQFIGYVQGVHDTLDAISICSPENVTAGQLNAVVKKYLDANPEKWGLEANMLIYYALSKAFPCKK